MLQFLPYSSFCQDPQLHFLLLLCSAFRIDLCTCFFTHAFVSFHLRIHWWADCALILYSTQHWISCTIPLCMKTRKFWQKPLNIIRFYLKTNYRIKKISGKAICLSRVYKDIGKDGDVKNIFGNNVCKDLTAHCIVSKLQVVY